MRKLIVRSAILLALVFLSRVIFQFPVEYFGLEIFRQTAQNRLFSKIDALKILAVVGLFFLFYYSTRLEKLKLDSFSWKKSAIYIILAELLIAAYYLVRSLSNTYDLSNGPLVFVWLGIIACLGASFLMFSIAVFGTSFIKGLYYDMKYELIFAGAAAIVMYNLLMFMQSKWLIFSTQVTKILFFLLSIFYNVQLYYIESGPVLSIGDFAVTIGAPCSGIDSMFLFVAFMAVIFAIDKGKYKTPKFLAAAAVGFVGVYFINVFIK